MFILTGPHFISELPPAPFTGKLQYTRTHTVILRGFFSLREQKRDGREEGGEGKDKG
jgi:hypothetical protein